MTRFAWLARGRHCPPAWKLTRAASSEPRDPEIEKHRRRVRRMRRRARGAARAGCGGAGPSGAAGHEQGIARRDLGASAGRAAGAATPGDRSRRAARSSSRRSRRRSPSRSPSSSSRSFVVARRPRSRRAPAPAPPPRPRTSRASIRAIGNARFVRAQPPPDEIVRLDDGRIELDVIPLAAGERFRVVTDNGEVEVRGTSFEVLAADRACDRCRCRAGASRCDRAAVSPCSTPVTDGSRRRRRAVRRPAPPRPRPRGGAGRRSSGRTSARPRPRARCSIAPGRRCARATPATRPPPSPSSNAAPGAAPSRRTLFTGARSPSRAPRTAHQRGCCSGSSCGGFRFVPTGRSGGRARLDPAGCRERERGPTGLRASDLIRRRVCVTARPRACGERRPADCFCAKEIRRAGTKAKLGGPTPSTLETARSDPMRSIRFFASCSHSSLSSSPGVAGGDDGRRHRRLGHEQRRPRRVPLRGATTGSGGSGGGNAGSGGSGAPAVRQRGSGGMAGAGGMAAGGFTLDGGLPDGFNFDARPRRRRCAAGVTDGAACASGGTAASPRPAASASVSGTWRCF